MTNPEGSSFDGGSLSPGSRALLGVVLAGGRSRRFGSEKALSRVAGRPMAEWVLSALKPWTAAQVVVGNDGAVGEVLGLQCRRDLFPGKGPIGGLHTGLDWARERGLDGVFLLACDLPLITDEIVGRILRAWPSGAGAVVPSSQGPLGYEPLCGGYDVRGLKVLEGIMGGEDLSMARALSEFKAHRIPRESLGEPLEVDRAFTNVNTQAEAERAEAVLTRPQDRMGLDGRTAG